MEKQGSGKSTLFIARNWNDWTDDVAVDPLMLSLTVKDAATYIHSLNCFRNFSHAELLYRLDDRFGAAHTLAMINASCFTTRRMKLMINRDKT